MANVRISVSTNAVRVHPSVLSPAQRPAAFRLDGEPFEVECAYDPECHTAPAAIETAEAQAAREAVAIKVCESCPARQFCFGYALEIRPDTGVWAGMTAEEIDDLAYVLGTFNLDQNGPAAWVEVA
ncbi:hypothetical protein Aple_073640 [Acrocarpospora pleiomorpha]|uniref:4Fe-4S Wbl-type domain-containing protein n=1 Tax=Acrocarpospora pleiomorpha TaxID=90975 RepID=A0A5M3XTA7_9ACTN|nr:WhiB family transcriptional regulator [Acrocarpospora pleiomorpha]GES24465.1 hypothetical protein Aple_073640 [Acrocarpospora pleiomorpha]